MSDLARFVDAQGHGTYEQALDELRAGDKRSHWMWFVFPQLAGLGSSPTARHYAIADLAEARAYLGHDVLGPRLLECCAALLMLDSHDPQRVLGSIDAMKLRSSVTLFLRAAPDQAGFQRVLDQYFDGSPDPKTDDLLGR